MAMFEGISKFFSNMVSRGAADAAAATRTAMIEQSANLERRDFDLKSQEALRLFAYGLPSVSSTPVTDETVLGLAPFFAAAKYLSQGIAMLDREVVRKAKAGTTVAEKHPLFDFFNGRPHPQYSWFDLLSALMANACLGNGYARIWRDEFSMRPEMLEHIPAGMVWMEYGVDGSLWYRVSGELNGRAVSWMVPSYDMIHIKGFSLNALNGKRVSLVHSSVFGAALDAQKYGQVVYAKGAHSSFAVKYDQPLEETEAIAIENRIGARLGRLDKAGTPFVIDDGMDIVPIQWNPDEVMLIDFLRLQAEHVSMITQVPMEMLRSESTGTYGAALMRSQNFLTHGLQPFIEKIQEEFNSKLFWEKEYRARKVFFRFDTSMYVRMDKETEKDVLTGLVMGMILTPNEARKRLGLVDVKGGDTLYRPSGMVPLEQPDVMLADPLAENGDESGSPKTDKNNRPKPSAKAQNQDIEDEAESGIVAAE